LRIERKLKLSFSDLKLKEGDRVVCSLLAVDYRGPGREAVTQGESLVFEVTDRNTLLKALSEADEKIDEDLERIIQAESGLGVIK